MIIILICLQCWQKKEECKCEIQTIEQFVEIDDRIYKAIRNLNLLGYKTKFCCEGHTDNGSIQAYIFFDWDKGQQMFETLPEGWLFDSYSYRKVKHYKYNIIRSIIPNNRKLAKLTDKQKQEIIDRNIDNLTKWSENLDKKRTE